MSQNEHFDPNSYTAVLSRLAAQLDSIDEKVSGFLKTMEQHEARITALEKWRGKLVAMGTVIGAVGVYFGQKLFEHISK